MFKADSLLSKLFFTTVRIVGHGASGEEYTGTSFFFNYRFGTENHVFLVTNNHVIEDMVSCRLTFHRRKGSGPDLERTVTIEIKDLRSVWYHNDCYEDLAILPVSSLYNFLSEMGDRIYIQTIDDSLIPTKKDLKHEIGAIEDVYFLGYPNDIFDEVNNLPVLRKGTTSTPVTIDFEGMPKFLLDGNIFPGSSGSPVLLIDTCDRFGKEGGEALKRRIYFLGVLGSGFIFSERSGQKVDGPGKKKKGVLYKQMMDLGVVIKSRVLHEMVEDHMARNKPLLPDSAVKEKVWELLGLSAGK